MNYESIILELLTRIQKLEEELAELKKQVGRPPVVLNEGQAEDRAVATEQAISTSRNTYNKLTDEMIDMCYRCGKMMYRGEDPQELADTICEATGMNRSSAIIYLHAVNSMLSGAVFKRAISAKAITRYFDCIFNDFGSKGLKAAIHATRQHVAYRRDCGQNVDSIEALCDRFDAKL